MKGQRCVILADGFYEWQRQEKGKQPFFIYFPQNQGPGLQKGQDQDGPMISSRNKENSETVCPPEEASLSSTEVCIGFSVAIWAPKTCASSQSRSRKNAAVAEITTAENIRCGREARAKVCMCPPGGSTVLKKTIMQHSNLRQFLCQGEIHNVPRQFVRFFYFPKTSAKVYWAYAHLLYAVC